MPVRNPVVAGRFYPAQERACREEVEKYLRQAKPFVAERYIQGGLVPHAGWTFSAPTAGRVLAALGAQEAPETVVLFGAVHSWGVDRPSMYGSGAWRTPLGELLIDEELADKLRQTNSGLLDRPEAHAGEHSIEVQLPFIKYLFPDACILPISTPPLPSAVTLGQTVARVVQELDRRVVALGSSDLTHYGPQYGLAPAGVGEPGLEWAKQNDARVLDLATRMLPEDVLEEAHAHHNACGAGAIAATIAFAAARGATEGVLLHYTTSHEVMPMGRPTDFVGYGAVVYF
ncbi:MAG: AmmeMemoRadiSam system protein B [Chloroflexi bacterium]|nr:AmmeMemoRadiSam system protein B [Chloroflexota bacterium]